ncbi:hypothetical protein Bbelb_284150 [Branchiostoma belcheri]|nr:hypothetical protein Bbelb_284150 [Branchiostoma belcheri]
MKQARSDLYYGNTTNSLWRKDIPTTSSNFELKHTMDESICQQHRRQHMNKFQTCQFQTNQHQRWTESRSRRQSRKLHSSLEFSSTSSSSDRSVSSDTSYGGKDVSTTLLDVISCSPGKDVSTTLLDVISCSPGKDVSTTLLDVISCSPGKDVSTTLLDVISCSPGKDVSTTLLDVISCSPGKDVSTTLLDVISCSPGKDVSTTLLDVISCSPGKNVSTTLLDVISCSPGKDVSTTLLDVISCSPGKDVSTTLLDVISCSPGKDVSTTLLDVISCSPGKDVSTTLLDVISCSPGKDVSTTLLDVISCSPGKDVSTTLLDVISCSPGKNVSTTLLDVISCSPGKDVSTTLLDVISCSPGKDVSTTLLDVISCSPGKDVSTTLLDAINDPAALLMKNYEYGGALLQVIHGLSYLHQVGILHNDLKMLSSAHDSCAPQIRNLPENTRVPRRSSARLVLFYKAVNSLIAIPVQEYLTKNTNPTRGHSLRYTTLTCKTDTYRASFFPRTVAPAPHQAAYAVQLNVRPHEGVVQKLIDVEGVGAVQTAGKGESNVHMNGGPRGREDKGTQRDSAGRNNGHGGALIASSVNIDSAIVRFDPRISSTLSCPWPLSGIRRPEEVLSCGVLHQGHHAGVAGERDNPAQQHPTSNQLLFLLLLSFSLSFSPLLSLFLPFSQPASNNQHRLTQLDCGTEPASTTTSRINPT